VRQQASAYTLAGSLAFTRAPSTTRKGRKLHYFYSFLQTVWVASLTSSATFGGPLDIALRLSVFSSLGVFILCMTDTDDVALLELQVAVLLISRLRFC